MNCQLSIINRQLPHPFPVGIELGNEFVYSLKVEFVAQSVKKLYTQRFAIEVTLKVEYMHLHTAFLAIVYRGSVPDVEHAQP